MLVPVRLQEFPFDLFQPFRFDPARDEREEAEQAEDESEGSFLVDQGHDGGLLDRKVYACHQIWFRREQEGQLDAKRDEARGDGLCWSSRAVLNSSVWVTDMICSLNPVSAAPCLP